MYKKKDLLRNLKRDLRSEFEVINFYIENLDRLNYKLNKVKVNTLIMESFKHANMIASEILKLKKSDKSSLTEKARKMALKEESAVKEIYRFQLTKVNHNLSDDDAGSARKLFHDLIMDEARHEKLVKALK